MAGGGTAAALENVSAALAEVVERVAPSVVRVDDGTRLTASGLIWSADGIILTTSHGVQRDEDLEIELAEGIRHRATLVGRDEDTDLAVLRVEATGLPAVETAEPDSAQVGHLVLALGRPGDWGLHATLGIVSARLDTERQGQGGYILHTDAVLYPGFSGGALVDTRGQVVGVVDLLFGRGKGVAIGVPVARQVAEALLAHGQVRRAFLGVTAQSVPLTAALVEKIGRAQERAALVLQVAAGSPAERAGLLLGDLLLRVAGEPVEDPEGLRKVLRARTPGEMVPLEILRGGEPGELEVTLGTA